MAFFTGTGADETIIPTFVSPTVTASPSGTFPSTLGDLVEAGGGRDTIDTGGGDDFLFGEDGDDLLRGGLGGDRLDGGAGTDTASYSGSAKGVNASLSTGFGAFGDASGDVLFGIENLIGSAQADGFTGDAGANLLDGLGGDDNLQGRAGADIIIGGVGSDAASYLDSSAGVFVNLATGVALFGHAAGDQLSGIENLTGSGDNADTLVGDAGVNALNGMGGGDVLRAGGGDDVLFGQEGDDLFQGGAGADALNGGAGLDTADYADSGEAVLVSLGAGIGRFGSAAGDTLVGIEKLSGSAFADQLAGDALANDLAGQGGEDLLLGDAGDDAVRGGSGNDQLRGGSGADTLDGGSGLDTANYDDSAASVTVDLALGAGAGTGGTAEGDHLSAIEDLGGSNFADALAGDALANALNGRDGADMLEGRAGSDTLSGGSGADVFSFAPGGGSDLVLDFTDGADHLRFTGFGPAFDTAAEIVAAASAVGDDTRIALPNPGAGQTLATLVGFDIADLDTTDFLLA